MVPISFYLLFAIDILNKKLVKDAHGWMWEESFIFTKLFNNNYRLLILGKLIGADLATISLAGAGVGIGVIFAGF